MNRRELLKFTFLAPLVGLFKSEREIESPIKYHLWYRDDYFCYVLLAEKDIDGCRYEIHELIDNPTPKRIASSKAIMVKKFNRKEELIRNGGHWFEPKTNT